MMTPLEASLVTIYGFAIAIFGGFLGYNIGRDKERDSIRRTQAQPQPPQVCQYEDVELEELRKMVGLTERQR